MFRRRKKAVEVVKELDTFTKTSSRTPEELVDKSSIGGILTLIAACLMAWLVTSELYSFYFRKHLKFTFSPDVDLDEKLKVNIDITVAMPCFSVGADIVDATDQAMVDEAIFSKRDVQWELSESARNRLEHTRMLNTYLTEEYHAVQKLLYQSSYRSFLGALGADDDEEGDPPKVPGKTNACRIVASTTVNKVSGNLHVTSGKPFVLPDNLGHIHFSLVPQSFANYSHRIRHFSFGSASAGIVHPLDGEEKYTNDNTQLFQYMMEVVPVDVNLGVGGPVTGYQLSVKENARVIDHDAGSHGSPGISFRYSMSPVRVGVLSAEQSALALFISLFSTIAGIAVSFGIIRDALQWVEEILNPRSEGIEKSVSLDVLVKPGPSD